jgi:glutamate-1-semialdehyde 2,1-aminomutase
LLRPEVFSKHGFCNFTYLERQVLIMSPHRGINENAQCIASAVTDAHTTYLNQKPNLRQSHTNATEHLPGGNTRTVLYAQPFHLAIISGAGNTLISADGHNYIDFLGKFSAGLFGHSNPLIAETVTNILNGGWNFSGENMYEKELACKVTARFSEGGMDLIRFTNSGTETNMTVLRAAIAWTGGRKKVLVLSNGCHGSTIIFPMGLCRWIHFQLSSPPPFTSMNSPA